MTKGQIHRFHDWVAVHLGVGETVYLDVPAAWEVAHGITMAAADIEARRFRDSRFSAASIAGGQSADGKRWDYAYDRTGPVRQTGLAAEAPAMAALLRRVEGLALVAPDLARDAAEILARLVGRA